MSSADRRDRAAVEKNEQVASAKLYQEIHSACQEVGAVKMGLIYDRVRKAKRWSMIKNSLGWAAVLTGDWMPKSWFNGAVSEPGFRSLIVHLEQCGFRECISNRVVAALGRRASPGLRQDLASDQFLDSFHRLNEAHPHGDGAIGAVSLVVAAVSGQFSTMRDLFGYGALSSLDPRPESFGKTWPQIGNAAADLSSLIVSYISENGVPLALASFADVISAIIPKDWMTFSVEVRELCPRGSLRSTWTGDCFNVGRSKEGVSLPQALSVSVSPKEAQLTD